jgi:CHAT domain-containing protein
MVRLIHSSSSTPEVIWQGAFTEANLNELLVKRKDGKAIGGYLPGQLSNPLWLTEALTEALPLLGKQLLAPVATRLSTLKASGVCLIPMGLLGLLPLHAARYQIEGRETSLLDEFDVAYAPSARVLRAVRNETQVRQNQLVPWRLIGIGNPLVSLDVGAWAQIELQRIAPGLQHIASILVPQMRKSAITLPLHERTRVQSLATLYEKILQSLQILSHEPASRLIHEGGVFSLAVALFTQLSVLPRAIQATLEQLAVRIPPSLIYSRAEVESIAELLPAQRMVAFYEQHATLQAIWEILPQAEIAHFSCHGHFNAAAPLDSAVLLACDTRLTLGDLLNTEPQHLAHLRLVFLSACQTAITDYQRIPDEVVGLPAGFLQVGVPSVAGTLWSVNDQSTALLVTRFYELYLQGDEQTTLPPQPPVRALRLAQRWLRDLTNIELLQYLQDHQHFHKPQESEVERLSPMLTAEMQPALRNAIHEGRGKEHPYANPYYWAAFAYYGAV